MATWGVALVLVIATATGSASGSARAEGQHPHSAPIAVVTKAANVEDGCATNSIYPNCELWCQWTVGTTSSATQTVSGTFK